MGEEVSKEVDYKKQWEDRIAEAIAEGVPMFQKNGLPIVCQRGFDGALLEHEHADHATYMFPVEVEFKGTQPDFKDVDPDLVPYEVAAYLPHDEALIYHDTSIALTMYECCYTLWHRHSKGAWIHGAQWNKNWALTEAAYKKIWPETAETDDEAKK